VSPVAVGEMEAVNATEPVKPKLLAVIVEVVPRPARTVAVVGLAATVKSPTTVRVTVAVCVRAPLVPVTVTV